MIQNKPNRRGRNTTEKNGFISETIRKSEITYNETFISADEAYISGVFQ